MSAPRPLPDRPNLDQLKTQAKELLRAHRAGEAAAVERLRAALPELAQASDDDLLGLKFALLDAQRAVASEYGFATWPELARHVEAAAEGTFDDLFQYGHGTCYLISHEVDEHDLAVVLHVMTASQRNAFWFNMPDDMRARIEADTEATQASAEQVEAARERMLAVVKRLAAEGQLARLMGILHLGQLVDGIGDPLLRTGLRMALDGTEPDRITEVLENQMRTLLHEQEVRYRKAIVGLRSVQKGDNPAFTRETLDLIP